MAIVARLDIDLSFSLQTVAADGEQQSDMTGTITSSGLDVDVFVDNPDLLLAGRSTSLRTIRAIAGEIAQLGLSVSLSGPEGLIARVGNVKSTLAQRIVTGSRHITVGKIPALMAAVQGGRSGPSPIAIPPGTLFPVVPTFNRRLRKRVTTTHYARGGGRPRLIFVVGSKNWDGRPPREFDLVGDVTTIGSSSDAVLTLPGLQPFHAEIRHRDDDEFVLHLTAPEPDGGLVAQMTGRTEDGRVLRTGARIELGQWRMAFFREEYADHGRPFGGRVGGELAFQRPQQDPRRARRQP